VQSGVDVGSQDAHAVDGLLGSQAAALNDPLAGLVVEIAGDDGQVVAVLAQVLGHLEMACVAGFVR